MAQQSDTRVLVTGGTSGLGRAMVQALAQAGARVAVTSRHRERAQAAAAELGAGALGVELDVRDASSVSAAVDSVYGMLGGLDVLVNNAAVFPPHPIAEVDYDQWQRAWTATLAVARR